ncbi:keratin, type I cytoskeletal 9-like [Vitis riparia]|uniref:keratin, type I cytoskeletal 9-like n=1 Tax=Vitis riparia TaxID=96939 RepID=UPI00155AA60B|nr:keratin, type I cytoskeletal 9-like [Vitis riparia]
MDSASISANVNNIPVLNGTNFKKWKKHVIIVLGCMDLDYALREDRLVDLTSANTAKQRDTMEKWELSNRMSLMIMKHSILEAIRGAIPKESRAKTFLDQIANRFAANEKVETSTILNKLVSMRYKGKENIKEYIMEMSNLVARLKALKLELSENILVYLDRRMSTTITHGREGIVVRSGDGDDGSKESGRGGEGGGYRDREGGVSGGEGGCGSGDNCGGRGRGGGGGGGNCEGRGGGGGSDGTIGDHGFGSGDYVSRDIIW